MANNRKVKKGIKSLRQIKTWQLVVLLVLGCFIAATFLRLNNIGMMQRRDAVLVADRTGDREALQHRLYDLQRWSSSHMNASTGGFYLEETYHKDVELYYARASNDDNPNGNIFVQAQEVCAPRFSGWSMAYVQCVTQELEKYPSSDNIQPAGAMPRSETYRHSFASPLWSPDFAGFSVLIVLIIALIIGVRIVAFVVLYGLLRWRSREI